MQLHVSLILAALASAVTATPLMREGSIVRHVPVIDPPSTTLIKPTPIVSEVATQECSLSNWVPAVNLCGRPGLCISMVTVTITVTSSSSLVHAIFAVPTPPAVTARQLVIPNLDGFVEGDMPLSYLLVDTSSCESCRRSSGTSTAAAA